MVIGSMMATLAPAASAALQLAAAGVKKRQEADAINTYIDRSKVFNALFAKNEQDAETAWGDLMAIIMRTLAEKGITPSTPWYDEATKTGSPCVKIPVASLKELLDAASR